jgi:hypothetical protein
VNNALNYEMPDGWETALGAPITGYDNAGGPCELNSQVKEKMQSV